MPVRIIHKLVRDRVILRIENNGEEPAFSIIAPEEMPEKLCSKLLEEIVEMEEAAAPEFPRETLLTEIADVLEILRELVSRHGILWERFYVRQYRYEQWIAQLGNAEEIALFRCLMHAAEVAYYQKDPAKFEEDLLKVFVMLLAIIRSRGIEWCDVEKARIAKRSTHGGFEKGWYLMSTR